MTSAKRRASDGLDCERSHYLPSSHYSEHHQGLGDWEDAYIARTVSPISFRNTKGPPMRFST